MSHTKEQMFQYEFSQLARYENGRTPILLTEEQYNRARACVNACDGISTERLEDLGQPLMNHLFGADEHAGKLVKQRDELLAAIQSLSFAAMSREITMGDQCSLIEVKAELASANKLAMEVIARIRKSNGQCYYAPDGTLMNPDGSRSIFDDVDQ